MKFIVDVFSYIYAGKLSWHWADRISDHEVVGGCWVVLFVLAPFCFISCISPTLFSGGAFDHRVDVNCRALGHFWKAYQIFVFVFYLFLTVSFYFVARILLGTHI